MDASEEVSLVVTSPCSPTPAISTLEDRLAALGLRFSSSLGELKQSRGRSRRFGFIQQLQRQNALSDVVLVQPDKVKPTDTQGVMLKCLWWETTPWVRIFRILTTLSLFYSVLTSLFFLGFNRPSEQMLQVDRAFQVLFAGECIAAFFITRKDENGYILIARKLVARSYLQSWFLPDIVALIPFRELGYEDVNYLARLPRLLKLASLIRSMRANLVDFTITAFKHSRLAPKILQVSYYVRTLAGLGETLFHLSLLTYALSCVFMWFSEMTQSWQSSELSARSEMSEKGVYLSVLQSMYFFLSTLTTVGYGDFVPRNVWERCFMIVVLFIGVVIFSIFVGQLNARIVEYQMSSDDQEQTDLLLAWISNLEHRFGHLPSSLKSRILSHYSFYHCFDRLKTLAKSYWHYRSFAEMQRQDSLYVEHLPKETLHGILDDLFSDVFYKFRTFFGASEVKYVLAQHLQPRTYQLGEDLIEENTIVQELVFVMQGSVLCGVKVYGKMHSIVVFEEGWTLLGDYEILTEEKSIATYQCAGTKPLLALAIPRKAVAIVLGEGFPEAKFQMIQRAQTRRKDLKKLISEFSASLSQQMTSLQGFITGLLIRALSDVKGYHTFAQNLRKRFIAKQRLELQQNSECDLETTEGELYCETEDEITENKAFKGLLYECTSAVAEVRMCGEALEHTRKKMSAQVRALRSPLQKLTTELRV